MQRNNNSVILPASILSIKNFLVNSIALFLPIYFVSIGFSGLQIGILISVFAVTSLISSSLVGFFSDRYPIKYLSVFSFSLLIIYSFGLSTTKNFWIIFILFLLGGLGNNISEISLTSFVFKIIEKKRAGKKLGIFNSITTIASGLGALIGGLLLAKINFTNIFALLALLFFLAILFSLFIKKIVIFRYSIQHYKGDLFKPEILFFIIIIFVFTLHWGAEYTSYALLLKNNLNLDQTVTGLYLGSAWIIYGIFIYFVSRHVDKDTFLSKTLYLGLVLSGLGHILFIYPNIFYSYLFRLMHEFGDAAIYMFLFLGMHRHFPSERIGGTLGLVLAVTIAGRFLGSLIFGPIGDLFGYHYPFIISGILTLLCLIIAYNYVNVIKSKNENKIKTVIKK